MSPGLTEAVIEGFEHGGLVFGVVKASPVVGGKDAGDCSSQAVALSGYSCGE